MTAARIHLAKQPGAAVLTSWCGVSERRARKKDGGTLYCTDENPIVQSGNNWTCDFCALRMRAESTRILGLLGARSAEVEALRDAALATSCGNHGCICAPVRGMGTNGACHCLEAPQHVRAAMMAWRRYATALEGHAGGNARGAPAVAQTSDEIAKRDQIREELFSSKAWPKTRQQMRHALGLDNGTGAKRAYRNRFVLSSLSEERAAWEMLVNAGLATCHHEETTGARDRAPGAFDVDVPFYTFSLTQAGIVLVTEYSEREKPEAT